MIMTGRTLHHIEGEGHTVADDHTMLGEAPAAAGDLQRLRALLATWRTSFGDTRQDGATFWAN